MQDNAIVIEVNLFLSLYTRNCYQRSVVVLVRVAKLPYGATKVTTRQHLYPQLRSRRDAFLRWSLV